MIKLKDLLKEDVKIYVKQGVAAPKGKKIQTGPRGGKYFMGTASEKKAHEKPKSDKEVPEKEKEKKSEVGTVSKALTKILEPADSYMDNIIDIEEDTMGEDDPDSLVPAYKKMKDHINKEFPGAKMFSEEDTDWRTHKTESDEIGALLKKLGDTEPISKKSFENPSADVNMNVLDYGDFAVFKYRDYGGGFDTLIVKDKDAQKTKASAKKAASQKPTKEKPTKKLQKYEIDDIVKDIKSSLDGDGKRNWNRALKKGDVEELKDIIDGEAAPGILDMADVSMDDFINNLTGSEYKEPKKTSPENIKIPEDIDPNESYDMAKFVAEKAFDDIVDTKTLPKNWQEEGLDEDNMAKIEKFLSRHFDDPEAQFDAWTEDFWDDFSTLDLQSMPTMSGKGPGKTGKTSSISGKSKEKKPAKGTKIFDNVYDKLKKERSAHKDGDEISNFDIQNFTNQFIANNPDLDVEDINLDDFWEWYDN